MAYGTVNADVVQSSVSGVSLGAGNASIMKNRIINGAMVIDQRNNGASGTNSNSFTVDRWHYYAAQASKFTWGQNLNSVTPPAGFSNYLGLQSSSAYTALTTDIFEIFQPIEGFNTADLNFGTANAKTITLSAWVQSSLTGTFGGFLSNSASNRFYYFTYTIPVANTWTQISITITGDTTGTWVGATNGTGLVVSFTLSSASGGGTAGSWTSTVANYPAGTISVVGTNGATFYITGVQLEVGSSATGFEYRQYQQELALCQRYYWKSTQIAGNNAGVGFVIGTGTTTYTRMQIQLPIQMRAVPTVVLNSVSLYNPNSGAGITTTLGSNYSSVNLISLDGSTNTNTNPQGGSLLAYVDGASAYVSASAEL